MPWPMGAVRSWDGPSLARLNDNISSRVEEGTMNWPDLMAGFAYGRQLADDAVDDGEEDFYGLGLNLTSRSRSDSGERSAFGTASNGVGSIIDNYQDRLTSIVQNLGGEPDLPLEPAVRHVQDIVQGAAQSLASSVEQQRKVENQRKAAQLRAKLIAQRQNTPSSGISHATTPNMTLPDQPGEPKVEPDWPDTQTSPEAGSDLFGLESLLAEGKAAAEAKAKENAASVLDQNYYLSPNASRPQPASGNADPGLRNIIASPSHNMRKVMSEQPPLPARLTDEYYSDLPVWLEATGYHDVEYRNSKLATYKERKTLEQEAARIQERLEKLRQAEQADLASLRSTVPLSTVEMPKVPPTLPAMMPNGITVQSKQQQQQQQTPKSQSATLAPSINGVKRARSPEPVLSEKSVRRYEDSASHSARGANGAQDSTASPIRRRSSPSSAGLDRRMNYPEVRRRSGDAHTHPASRTNEFRDPSSEHRQKPYKLEVETAASVPPPERYPRPETNSPESSRGRLGYSSVNKPSLSAGFRGLPQQYRGSAGLDLRKGGVRYFMIKSWNHQNVAQAMRDGLWATQEKNEQLLTEAYKTSRHVVLLFSVNKSTQFQGYALMASPPDPSLPKPTFVAKLNWATSPTFTLRWLAKTAVHFRHVGHLKNELNLDDRNQPMAVLVGKDGQEISPAAGMGVVEILDEAEEAEGHKQSHNMSGPMGMLASRW